MSMAKHRGRRSDIYKAIVETLKTGSYNILQISEKTEINWETVRSALETLEKIEVVSKDNNKYFLDQTKMLNIREDTLLGLPLTKEQENKIYSIARRVQEKWNSMTKRPLKKTFLQKILIRLIKEEEIKGIPYGWYLFGLCTVLQVDPQNLREIEPETGYDKKIEPIIEEYSQISTTNELLLKHYREEGNSLYLSKMKFSNILMNVFDENSISMLKNELRNIQFSFPKKEENKEIVEYLNGFASIVVRLVNKLNIRELEELRQNIFETFTAVWEMIGVYNLYESVLEFYGQTAKKYYLIRMEAVKNIVESYLTALQDNIPVEEKKEDSLSAFKGIRA